MPTEHDYIDVRDLFASINPNGLDEKDLARDGASFVEPHTINDYHLFRAGYQAALEAQQGQGESIRLTAVATLEEDGDGGLEPNWLLEGGTAELFAGMTLLVADNAPHLCDDDGSAQLYTHADPAEVERLRADLAEWKDRSQRNVDAAMEATRKYDDLRAKLTEIEARMSNEHTESVNIGMRYQDQCKALRAQLAEAQALLREIADHCNGCVMPTEQLLRDWGSSIDAHLSASAEPSEERGSSHGFEQSPNTCQHDERSTVWWREGNVTRTGQECRDCGNVKEDPVASGCGYSIGDWECRPGGYLFDAGTGEGYDPQDCTDLCPHCRTQDFLESAKKEAESVYSYSGAGGSGTGLDIWKAAERHALDANRLAALHALAELGPVEALDGEDVVLCNTQSAPVEIEDPVCKGAWQLGTACGKCRRCKENSPT